MNFSGQRFCQLSFELPYKFEVQIQTFSESIKLKGFLRVARIAIVLSHCLNSEFECYTCLKSFDGIAHTVSFVSKNRTLCETEISASHNRKIIRGLI